MNACPLGFPLGAFARGGDLALVRDAGRGWMRLGMLGVTSSRGKAYRPFACTAAFGPAAAASAAADVLAALASAWRIISSTRWARASSSGDLNSLITLAAVRGCIARRYCVTVRSSSVMKIVLTCLAGSELYS